MPPSTFASAAAGGNRDASVRADGSTGGTNEWVNRRTNGATQTFRRPSSNQATNVSASHSSNSTSTTGTNPVTSALSRENGLGVSNVASDPSSNTRNVRSEANSRVYVPPHRMANGSAPSPAPLTETRYSKDQMISLFRSLQEEEDLDTALDECYVSGWEPGNGAAANGTSPWTKKEESREHQYSANIAWNSSGDSYPLVLSDMTEEEREFFTSVNSLLKPPAQPTASSKDGNATRSDRKTSVSHNQSTSGSGFGLASPIAARPNSRRRETGDSGYPFPATTSVNSPSTSRFAKDELTGIPAPGQLQRRRTDAKESSLATGLDEKNRDKTGQTDASSPFSTMKRSVTGGPATAWSTSAAGGFSPMGSFNVTSRPSMAGGRSESRFKGLMTKEVENTVKNAGTGGSPEPDTDSIVEGETATAGPSDRQSTSRRQQYDDEDDDPSDLLAGAGSAALAGSLDFSPPRGSQRDAFGTPIRQDDVGAFGALGMTSVSTDHAAFGFPGLSGFTQHRDMGGWTTQQQTPQHQRTGGSGQQDSPTDTNPYQSPGNDQSEADTDPHAGLDTHGHLPGLGGLGAVGHGYRENIPLAGLGGLSGLERSQTGSAGPSRGFPTLGGLGGLPGLGASMASPWGPGPPTSEGPGAIGTPIRERPAFGFGPGPSSAFADSLFGAAGGDLTSPNLAGLGSRDTFPSAPGAGLGFGSIGRSATGSKMGSLFSREMRDEMRHHAMGRQSSVESGEGNLDGSSAFGRMGRGSPFRTNQGILDDDLHRSQTLAASDEAGSAQPIGGELDGGASHGDLSQHHASQSQQDVLPPLTAQVRRMVMPDRIRWIYKDPQGTIQGPFTGLEMNDWYKAGFFTPELLIRKVEDEDYEPLAQLIRRIGNSREPFLVPLLGIPQDSSPAPTPNASAAPSQWATAPNTNLGGVRGVVPPFANSFPSFGTTLTADQQNALERRKQEEQYLMALQKEHLAAQQQMWHKQQLQLPSHRPGFTAPSGPGFGAPQGLQHHASAQSLHSQPSFGSMNNPFPQNPIQGQPGGFTGQGPTSANQSTSAIPGQGFDNAFGKGSSRPGLEGPAPGSVLQEDLPGLMERLNMARQAPQMPIGPQSVGQHQNLDQVAVAQMLSDRERLQREQHEQNSLQAQLDTDDEDIASGEERLGQFRQLQGRQNLERSTEAIAHDEQTEIYKAIRLAEQRTETLTEQVRARQQQKLDISVIAASQQVVAPPQELRGSPIPAPVAQRRTAQTVAESLAAESRSRTQSPAVSAQSPSLETPSTSLAPWAVQSVEVPKGPGLKEIQEMEAKKARARELAEQEKRRQLLEKELLLMQQQTAASKEPAPGLPSSANWAAPSPAEVKSTASVWAATPVGKPAGTPTAGPKKTLQQIQKEEEAKKQRAAAQIAAQIATVSPTTATTQNLSSGKRYADLASKVTPAVAGPPGSWTTVGAGGKAKALLAPPGIPTGPAAATRAVSGSIPTLAQTAAAASKPKAPQRSTTLGSPALSSVSLASSTLKLGKDDALEEFKRWASGELRAHLSRGFNVTDFLSSLVELGTSDIDLITEAVHSASQTIDSRHFAEEFVRRRRLADKGIVDPAASASSRPVQATAAGNAGWTTVPGSAGQNPVPGAGGWNEIAKKGPVQKEESPSNFRVVAGKKKSGRR